MNKIEKQGEGEESVFLQRHPIISEGKRSKQINKRLKARSSTGRMKPLLDENSEVSGFKICALLSLGEKVQLKVQYKRNEQMRLFENELGLTKCCSIKKVFKIVK